LWRASRWAPLVQAHPARAKIRRWYFQQGRPIKRFCRDLGVSRRTVRKVNRSGATEFSDARSVQPQPKLGPWREELDRMRARWPDPAAPPESYAASGRPPM
jgi:hypothetical protein